MELKVIINCSPSFRKKAEYTLSTLLVTMGLKPKFLSTEEINSPGPVLYYGSPGEAPENLNTFDNPLIVITYQGNYFQDKRPFRPEAVRFINFKGGSHIPVLFYQGDLERVRSGCLEEPGRITILADLVASAFYFLSGWQEYNCLTRDKYGRFPLEESLQHKCGFLKNPAVNQYLELLMAIINKAFARAGMMPFYEPVWPEGYRFAVALTHDIDHVRKWSPRTFPKEFKVLAKTLLQKRGGELKRRSWVLLGYLLSRQDPYWVYWRIQKEERKHRFSSTFFFLGGMSHPTYDQGFALNREKVKRLVKELAEEGMEIGLHGSFRTWRNGMVMEDEAKLIRKITGDLRGVRQHYLRIDSQETFRLMEEAGLEYDSTLGFAESPGYRGAFAYPYFPYNIQEDRPFKVLEIPLVVMDASLHTHLGLGSSESRVVVQGIIDDLARAQGCGALLWHNGYFDDLDFPGFGNLYFAILEKIRREEGWGAPAGEINHWWRGRINRLASPVETCEHTMTRER